MTMSIDNWTKLVVVVLVSTAASILGYFGKLDSQAVVALLSASLGYVFGNGHGIASARAALNDIAAQLQTVQSIQMAQAGQMQAMQTMQNGEKKE